MQNKTLANIILKKYDETMKETGGDFVLVLDEIIKICKQYKD